MSGLQGPAEIIVDQWGIPHIYAGTTRDAIFLQGYNAARDRIWQIDLWRKRGLGLLARDFGPSYVAQDRAARLFLYRGDMDREWQAYGPDAKSYAEAFVAGVNAFVDEVRSGERPLPIEFRVAGTLPDRWTAEDVVRVRSHGLTRNVASEVSRARVACTAGLEADRLRRKLEPEWTTKVPEGLDPCVVKPEVLNDYDLATKEAAFARPGEQRTSLDPETFLAEAGDRASTIGSNNWTIAPSRTATGRPILANDPHRAHGVPSLRYIVHLNAPGLSVIGAGEPALPGISIGHNGQIAFGLTIFAIDQEDLYVYETNPDNPDQYRYGSGWEDVRVVRETVEVKGEAPREVELRFTRHGPVLHADPANRRAFAMRSVWFEPGTSAYFNSAEYMTAKDWAGFKAAMADWGAPSENQVYADTQGNIGWIAGGRSPLRPTWDGLMPVPGDGRHEWAGFLKDEELPQVYNPAKGWLATANEMNLPSGLPVPGAQARVRVDGSGAHHPHRGGARIEGQGDARGLDGAADGRLYRQRSPPHQAAGAARRRRAGPRRGAHDRADAAGLEPAGDQVQLVVAHVLERELVRRAAVVGAEAGDRGHVDLARADGHVAQLHVVEHALPQRRDGLCRCHGGLLWIGLPKPGDPDRRRTVVYDLQW